MDIFVRLLELYKKYGFDVSGGVFPWHFDKNYPLGATRLHVLQPFMKVSKQGELLRSGGGVSPIEVMLLACASRAMNPKQILIIGNAFGWSTFALGLANPDAKVVAIDALVEGSEAKLGFDLTKSIIKNENLHNISVVNAFSPNDLEDVCREYFDGSIDVVLIDGEHSNTQQSKDFHAVYKELSNPGVVFLHDVLNWNMVSSFNSIRASYPKMTGKILMRTPSGMGVFHTTSIPNEAQRIIDAFCVPTSSIRDDHSEVQKRVRNTREILGFGIEITDDAEKKDTSVKLVKNE